jgi:hypothetical protein
MDLNAQICEDCFTHPFRAAVWADESGATRLDRTCFPIFIRVGLWLVNAKFFREAD